VCSPHWPDGLGGGVRLDAGMVDACTVVSNTSLGCVGGGEGGGVYHGGGGTIRNSIVYSNTGPGGDNVYDPSGTLDIQWSCTPDVFAGTGNFTNAPGFVDSGAGDYRLTYASPCRDSGTNQTWMTSAVDAVGNPRVMASVVDIGVGNIEADPRFVDEAAGDFHLRYDSPCIDSGTNLTGITNDLDGLPRPLDGDFDGVATSDMGAYEYNPDQDGDSDTMPDGWEYRHGLDPTNAADATADGDGDGMDNRGEHTADTNPTNPASLFVITAISNQITPAIYFPSSSQREYSLLSRPSLTTGQWSLVEGQTNIPGDGGVHFLTDSNAPPTTTYRLKVAIP